MDCVCRLYSGLCLKVIQGIVFLGYKMDCVCRLYNGLSTQPTCEVILCVMGWSDLRVSSS
jgi:hypothetical protein